MFIRILFLIIFPVTQALALETDNYLVWDKELKESSALIDQYFAETIHARLNVISDHEKKSCEDMTIEIAKEFQSRLVHDNPVENWLFGKLNDEEIYPRDLSHVDLSIYREPYRFYIPWFGLAPSIQVNGIYFGTDKLSHFASTGMIYFRIYRKHRARGASENTALEKAINWGIQDEKTVHGFWASGVFSYADLEANYQGLKFYRDFCAKKYLSRKNGTWELVKKPRISDYVNPHWDETFELSYRESGNWEKVSPVLKEEYCPKRKDPAVQERFAYYRRESSPSYSRNHLASADLPSPQNFDSLCDGSKESSGR